MANEAVIVELMGEPKGVPISFTVANSGNISGGTVLKLIDPKTASGAALGPTFPFAGIAAADKVSGDGAIKIAAYTKGIFDMVASGVINVGERVIASGANLVARATEAQVISGASLGRALETADDAEVIQVAVGIY